jgi:ATP-dependent DNA ligase
MALPLAPPILPALAKSGKGDLPAGEGWVYEPKWDGFRTIAFVDGSDLYLQSRGGKPMSRYFPEIQLPEGRYVVDGELLIDRDDGGQNFGALQERIHPAASRIQRLSVETPARFSAFDLLALGDDVLMERPYEERRALLEGIEGLELTPQVRSADEARAWLGRYEGVIAKELAAPYLPGKRAGMVKCKRVRTLDCVVMGYRLGTEEGTVGSLILGLYAPGGELHVMGHVAGFTQREKRALPARLAPYETGQRGSADPSRWAADRELEWVALRPELVVEVSYDHATDGRIRHGARLLRWRDDKAPRECTLEQLETT